MTRCLLMACSKAKSPKSNLLPAIERYDGPHFRVLRRFLYEVPSDRDDLEILILSAKYGLISGDRLVPNYDRIMTAARAEELHPQVLDSLKKQIVENRWTEIFVLMSAAYHEAIRGFEADLPSKTKVIHAEGAPGIKARQLRSWLYGSSINTLTANDVGRITRHLPRGYASIHGRSLSLTPAQVIEKAQQALRNGYGQPDNYRDWFVVVGEKRVGPKWLVGQITGLAVSDFTSSEARRVLINLGIEVHHI